MIVAPLMRNAPVIGSCYGFASTAVKVYNATSPSKAVMIEIKGVILDCTPPVIKYPALCLALATSCVASVATGGNPLAVSATITIGEAILECTLG